MIEGTKNSGRDDLSEFADYLAEFDSLTNFDNETCPVCGVNISDSLSIENSPFVQYKCLDEENEILVLTKELDLKCIPYKIEKRLNTEVNDKINYLFDILVPFKFLSRLEKSI
ncbi:MAG TPA: hypothetical protein VF870_06940 [Ignavibacteriaceae bacterium]